MVEWEFDVTYKGAPRMKMCQVAVQKLDFFSCLDIPLAGSNIHPFFILVSER